MSGLVFVTRPPKEGVLLVKAKGWAKTQPEKRFLFSPVLEVEGECELSECFDGSCSLLFLSCDFTLPVLLSVP